MKVHKLKGWSGWAFILLACGVSRPECRSRSRFWKDVTCKSCLRHSPSTPPETGGNKI